MVKNIAGTMQLSRVRSISVSDSDMHACKHAWMQAYRQADTRRHKGKAKRTRTHQHARARTFTDVLAHESTHIHT
eukprot:6199660-Pleurochrysis_carterae.AAC.2